MNPTVAVFEERIANLEGGCGAVAFASGIAAQAGGALHAAPARRPRRRLVGALRRHGQSVQAPAAQDERRPDVGRSRRPGRMAGGGARRTPRRFYGETIGNPGGNVLDIEAIAAIAHEHDAAADRRQHVRDAVPLPPDRVGRRHRHPLGDEVHRRPRHEHRRRRRRLGAVQLVERALPGRSPSHRRPITGCSSTRRSAPTATCMKLRAETLRDLGAAMSPFNAFLFLQGLETLSLRMDAARRERRSPSRRYLESHELASNVHLPGPAGSRYRALVDKYLPRGAGAVFSFDCDGGRAGGTGLHPRRHALVAPGERRRLEEPDHPSGEHDAPSARATTSCRAAGVGPGRSGSRSAPNRSTI